MSVFLLNLTFVKIDSKGENRMNPYCAFNG